MRTHLHGVIYDGLDRDLSHD